MKNANNSRDKNGLCIIAAGLLLCGSIGLAQANEERTGFYLGGSLGGSELDDDDAYRNLSLDDSYAAARIFGGYHFTPYFSLEASLSSLGIYEADDRQTEIESAFGASTFSAVGHLPLGAGFSLYGQAGVGFAVIYQDIRYVSGNNSLVTSDDDDISWGYVVGAGARYTPPKLKSITFVLGWERYEFSLENITVVNNTPIKRDVDQSIDAIQLGAAYNF